MATENISINQSNVYVEFISTNGDRHTIEANAAGDFILPAKEYRIYRIVEEKPEAIYQLRPGTQAYFFTCCRPACVEVCRG